MKLKNKVAVVTGAADGIGRAVATAMAEQGAIVVIADINEQKGMEAVEEIKSKKGSASFFKCDVGIEKDVKDLIDYTVQTFGSIDILHNNAAIAIGAYITEMREEDWQKVMNTNLASVFRGCKYAIPYMKENGGGSIINTASVQAHVSFTGWPAYAAAKGGVIALTKNLAVEYAPYNIRINTISPGTINTPMNVRILEEAEDSEALRSAWLSFHPIGRLGEPSEVANTVVFLASEDSSFITGVDIRVDGGLVLRP